MQSQSFGALNGVNAARPCVPFFTSMSELHARNRTCIRGDARHDPDVGARRSEVTDIYHAIIFSYDIYKAGWLQQRWQVR